MSKLINAYEVYRRPNGLLYRVPMLCPLDVRAEFYHKQLQKWLPSAHKVGGVLASSRSTLVALNVVFKDKACSQ